MEREKMIEEMAKIIDEMYNVYTTTAEDIAEGIYNAGYRKIGELEFDNEIIKFNMKETEKASFNINQMNGNLVLENQVLKDRIAELEDKIENGTLVELPCKVGDKVFTNIYGYGNLQNVFTVVSVDLLGFSSELYSWTWHQLGKSVFLTKAEAEAKLKELEGGKK